MNSTKGESPLGFKGLIGIAGCLIGLSVVYFGYDMGTPSHENEVAVEPAPESRAGRKSPVQAMNLALGDMVFFARDLGFTVTGGRTDDDVATNRIASRIEGQLHDIRALYRQEVAKNPALAGGLTLQLDIGREGKVTQVHELSSRLNNAEFKRAVAAAASNWSFDDLPGDPLQVRCPLLFVHEGMDITTLVHWEKALAESDKTAAPITASAPLLTPEPAPVAQPRVKEFQIKYATALRTEASFSSPSLVSLPAGTQLNVLGQSGDWLQVRPLNKRQTGFVRKEFVSTVEVARR